MIKIRSVLLILLLIGSSCGRNDDPSLPVPPGDPQTPHESESAEPTSCTKATGGEDSFVYLTAVRAADQGSSDRIVFEFTPPESGDAKIPKFEVEEVKAPLTKDPSDEAMQVEGERFFRVIFHGATGVELKGETVTERYRGPKEIKTGLQTLKEAEQQGDFEATLSWVMGLGKLQCPQITVLGDPLRVAFDFSH